MQKSLAALTNIFSIFLADNACAGAWLQEEGKFQAILNYNYLSTDQFFDAGGDKSSNIKFTKGEISPYIEYGLDSEWTIGGSLNMQSASSNGVSGNVTDLNEYKLAYGEAFARYELYTGEDDVISIEPRLKLPIEKSAGINPEGTTPIPELKASYGQAHSIFGEYDSFTDIAATYRLRVEDELADMIKMEASAGIRPFSETPILFLAQSFYELALTDISATSNSGNYELLKIQLSAAYEFDNDITVQAGLFSNVQGANTAAGNGILLSSWLNF